MNMQEVYKSEKPTFTDLVEVITAMRNDMKNGTILDEPKKLDKESACDVIFNPLLKEYRLLKDIYVQAKKDNSKEITKDYILFKMNELVKEQPGYEEALEYVLLEEENQTQDPDEEER